MCCKFSLTDSLGDSDAELGDALMFGKEGSLCMCAESLLLSPSLCNAGSEGWIIPTCCLFDIELCCGDKCIADCNCCCCVCGVGGGSEYCCRYCGGSSWFVFDT
jgi:hypothetical protein